MDYLFQSTPYLAYQGQPIEHAVWGPNGKTMLHWFVSGNEGWNAPKAPFGSISGVDKTRDKMNQLVQAMEQQAGNQRLQNLKWTNPPDGYAPDYCSNVHHVLMENHFQLLHQDLNFHIPLHISFRKQIHRSERWKLNKLHRGGFYFGKLDGQNLEEAFQMLEESRIRKGYKLSMTRKEIEEVLLLFPRQYGQFGVWQGNRLAAMAITVAVSSDILYTFYTADHLEFRKMSPVVLLHEGLHQFGAENNFKLLDLGTASLKGLVNSGVANFKRSLGGIASLKNTYIKQIGR